MGRVALSLGGVFVTLFISAATVDAASQARPWFLLALWVAAGVFGTLFLLAGLACASLSLRGYTTAIRIRNDWRCTYWPTEKQLGVTLWFDDHSDAVSYETSCAAQFGQTTVYLNDRPAVGGTYSGPSGFVGGKSGQPIMVEFRKLDVELEEPARAIISVRIGPTGFFKGAAKETTKEVSVQIVRH